MSSKYYICCICLIETDDPVTTSDYIGSFDPCERQPSHRWTPNPGSRKRRIIDQTEMRAHYRRLSRQATVLRQLILDTQAEFDSSTLWTEQEIEDDIETHNSRVDQLEDLLSRRRRLRDVNQLFTNEIAEIDAGASNYQREIRHSRARRHALRNLQSAKLKLELEKSRSMQVGREKELEEQQEWRAHPKIRLFTVSLQPDNWRAESVDLSEEDVTATCDWCGVSVAITWGTRPTISAHQDASGNACRNSRWLLTRDESWNVFANHHRDELDAAVPKIARPHLLLCKLDELSESALATALANTKPNRPGISPKRQLCMNRYGADACHHCG